MRFSSSDAATYEGLLSNRLPSVLFRDIFTERMRASNCKGAYPKEGPVQVACQRKRAQIVQILRVEQSCGSSYR